MARALEIDGLIFENSLKDCLDILFQQRTRELYLYYSKIFSERNIEVLHDTRVAARRLQALFKVFRSFFPQKKYFDVYSDLKQFIDLLGPVRELDVLTSMLGNYIAKYNITDVKALMLLFANLNYGTLERRAELFKNQEIIEFSDKQDQFIKFYEKYLSKIRKKKFMVLSPLDSFKENAANIITFLYDKVIRYKSSVINHPRNKLKLHRMRIKAKPMRYIMEIYLTAFKEDFAFCYEEIKTFVEKTGDVHDMDVLMIKLNKFLKEIRFFNKNQKSKKDHILTKPIRDFITYLKGKRLDNYNKICLQIKKWEKDKFKGKLINSVTQSENNISLITSQN